MCAQAREMKWRRHHSQQAVNTVSEPLEITLARNQTLGHEKVNLVQFRRHLTNIILCNFIKVVSGCCSEMLSNELLKAFSSMYSLKR